MTNKHDLSADTATVDFIELIKMARESAMTARIQCERAIGEFQNNCFNNDTRKMSNSARQLNEFAAVLARATEVLHVLNESQTREVLNIVNRPQIK